MVRFNRLVRMALLALVVTAIAFAGASPAAAQMHTSKPFSGAKVNGGTVTHTRQGGVNLLTLSDDFKVPDTPDPHWQVVDGKGRVYLLQKLMIKGDKLNKTITLPSYITEVAKVQIWCAWAETLLGEAPFDGSLQLTN